MKVADRATLQGDGSSNQDRTMTGHRYAAVLDGASQFPPRADGHDGGWYSERLAQALADELNDDEGRTLGDAVANAVHTVATAEQLTPGDAPSSTVTIARWNADHVEIYVLGDSPAIVFFADGSHQVVTDERLADVGREHRITYRARLLDGYGFDSTHRQLLADLQAEQQRQRNSAGGYWIAEAEPDAGHHGYTETFQLDQVAAVLLLTDGASAAVDKYARPRTWLEALEAVRGHGCAAFLGHVADVEEHDPDGSLWPRSKRHDDKTVALLT